MAWPKNCQFMNRFLALYLVLISISVLSGDVFPGQHPKVVRVFVALCDNDNQGIVPVPAKLGNGLDPENNLYWGARYGVRSFFSGSPDWKLIKATPNPAPEIIERCFFKRIGSKDIYLLADAYRGDKIRAAITDFLTYASGQSLEFSSSAQDSALAIFKNDSALTLAAYVGHDGLMDFDLQRYPKNRNGSGREAIVLACASKKFFGNVLIEAGAKPILLTTGLMAPEAYTLKAAIDGWALGESTEQIRLRASKAYDHYQGCGLKAARNLFTGY